jgi:ribosomal protein S18 acetylase RimI-like enzyme
MKQFIIREASTQDVERIYTVFSEADRLHRNAHPEIFRKAKSPKSIQDYMKDSILDPTSVIFLAERAGEILGTVQCRIQTTPEIPVLVPRKYAVIENISVGEGHKRSGVGKALMKRTEQWAKALGAQTIELTVWDFNQTAKEFYRKLDFRLMHQRMSKEL